MKSHRPFYFMAEANLAIDCASGRISVSLSSFKLSQGLGYFVAKTDGVAL